MAVYINLSWYSLPATQDLAAESPIPEQILEENIPQEVQPQPQATPCGVASLFLTPSHWLPAAVTLQIHSLQV